MSLCARARSPGLTVCGVHRSLMMYLGEHRAGDELQQGWEPEIQLLQQIHMSEYLQVDVSTLYSLQVLSQVACTSHQQEICKEQLRSCDAYHAIDPLVCPLSRSPLTLYSACSLSFTAAPMLPRAIVDFAWLRKDDHPGVSVIPS
jgi:hypothetical protein